jgi:ElaB/YqjD/DUF883 family membrane-anchored ribosome-binding protein
MADTTGRVMGNEFSNMGEQVKDTAQRVADSVNEHVDRGVDAARDLGNRASDTFEQATQYFRTHDIREMSDDLVECVKAHPLQALAGAVVIGFVAGRLLSRE